MKNLLKILVVWALGVFLLIPSMVMADLVTSKPTVEAYYKGVPSAGTYGWNGWYQKISGNGDTSFDISTATLTSGLLKITTGWPNASYSDLGAVAADLYLSSNSATWAIRLDSASGAQIGEVFKNPSMQTSVDFFGNNGGVVYGGAYGGVEGQHIPVWATSGDTNKTAGVSWSSGEVEISLNDIAGFDVNNFAFLYASATCGNSVLIGGVGDFNPVPIPPSALLLGTGLVALVGLGWRRRQSS